MYNFDIFVLCKSDDGVQVGLQDHLNMDTIIDQRPPSFWKFPKDYSLKADFCQKKKLCQGWNYKYILYHLELSQMSRINSETKNINNPISYENDDESENNIFSAAKLTNEQLNTYKEKI